MRCNCYDQLVASTVNCLIAKESTHQWKISENRDSRFAAAGAILNEPAYDESLILLHGNRRLCFPSRNLWDAICDTRQAVDRRMQRNRNKVSSIDNRCDVK